MIKIRLPRKETEVIFTLGLGFAGGYLAFFGKTVSNMEGLFLILAALTQFFFFSKVVKDEITLYGWSLISTLWSIPAFFIMWIILREFFFTANYAK